MTKIKLLSFLTILSLTIIGCDSHSATSSRQDSSSSSSSSIPPKTYNVTWQNYDGAVLEVDEEVVEGTMPTFDSVTPAKASDAQYDYVFAGWTPEVVAVVNNITYTATFTEELRSYTVVWKDENGDVLETDTNVPYGTVPEYNGDEPTKESTVAYDYTFDGWAEEIIAVEGDATYTATYKEELRNYNVTWKNEDGTVIKTEEVPYGTVPEYAGEDPIKEATVTKEYTFNGWSPNVAAVSGDVEYTALFQESARKYTVTWVNFDGEVLETDKVEYGETPVFNGSDPVRPNGHGVEYSWKGWSPVIKPTETDTVYTAIYDYEAHFDFSLLDYEYNPGYSARNAKGAPWINSSLQGQLRMIKKPSLKDDFYAAINYDDILDKVPGPFEVDSEDVASSMDAIYGGYSETTNADFLDIFYNEVYDGDTESLKNYANSFDLESYLSSQEIFSSPSSLLKLKPAVTAYEVAFNDGVLDEEYSIQSIWFYSNYYSQYTSYSNDICSKLISTFSLPISGTQRNNAVEIDKAMSLKAYGDSSTFGNRTVSYKVETLPWEPMKNALLDLGIESNTKVKIKKCYTNALNLLFNTYAVNQPNDLKNDILLRLAFDNRFLMGLASYKDLCGTLSNTGMFALENDFYYQDLDSLRREILKVGTQAAFEQSYIELSSSEETKAQVASLIEDILVGFKSIFNEIDWLGETTKAKILKKLAMMNYAACYSDTYKNLRAVDVSDANEVSLFELFSRYHRALIQDAVELKPDDPLRWAWDVMPSYTVNAFYAPSMNSFVILNGIVPGFLGESVEELYGMLGFVVGHEITHAFDSSGSQYDENGNRNNIMTSEDRSTFNNKVNKMISFYNKINLYDNNYVRGSTVDGEATADMGGIRVMLKLAESVENFNYDRFFKAAARTWCEQPYTSSQASSMLSNEHPFPYLRVNVTLAQFEKFYEVYDIQPGDGMYIPVDERVKIW